MGCRNICILLVAVAGVALFPFSSSKHSTAISDMNPQFRGLTPGDYFQNKDGLWLLKRSWVVPEPSAYIFIHHGYGEDSAKYAELATKLNKKGWSVYTHDAQGHGASEGDRMYVERYQNYIDDFFQYIDETVPKDNTLPVFAIGHSNGGLIVTEASIQRPEQFKGIVLSAPLIRDSVDMPIPRSVLIAVSGALSKLVPKLPVANVDVNKISRTPEIVEKAKNDPNFDPSRPTPARFGAEVLAVVGKRDTPEGFAEITTPFLIMHGTKDLLVKPEGSTAYYKGASSKDKEIKTYDGLYHELFVEPEKDEVIADTIKWISARI